MSPAWNVVRPQTVSVYGGAAPDQGIARVSPSKVQHDVRISGARSRRPLRVLFVTSMWPTDAEPWRGTFVAREMAAVGELGVEIDLWRIPPGGSWRGYTQAAARAFSDRPRAKTYDVVHAYYGHSAAIAAILRGPPVVITYCGSDLLGVQRHDGSWTCQSRLEVAAFRQVSRLASATITKSRQMQRQLPPACQKRNHVIPTGVDLARFGPLKRAEARRHLGWPGDRKIALFVGDPQFTVKNFPLASAACEIARESVPGLELKVAWGLHPRDIPACMYAADALLFTSRSEGSPNAVKEAMAAGLPIVSTPVGDVSERLAGVEGCWIEAPEPTKLAGALVKALAYGRSPAARAAIAELGVGRTAERILSVYRTVVRRAPATVAYDTPGTGDVIPGG